MFFACKRFKLIYLSDKNLTALAILIINKYFSWFLSYRSPKFTKLSEYYGTINSIFP